MSSAGTISNRYQLLEKLGQGGMGVVYKAYDHLDKQHVALKQVLIPDKHLDFGSKAGTDDTEKLRISLAREFSILATLRHPHILSVLDYGFDQDGHPFYTMTFLEGGQDVTTFATNITTGRRIKLIGQMLQALHYLHRRGILHRDLKPDNIFVTPDEQIKVMDFGLAKLDRRSSRQSGKLAGTLHYMAPELFQDEDASVASDLFAVGVVVYEIMAGRHPFEARVLGELIMKIMTHIPDMTSIPPEFVPWLERLLAKDATSRYATAYDAMFAFYQAVGLDAPVEDHAIRESFLQASNFVGRDTELKQLTDALGTIDTNNAFFLIGGESGVGKSRLLNELRIQALVKGATVLRGQGVEGGGLPFQLWRNIARRLLLMVDATDFQAGVLKDLVQDVSDLLGRDIPDAPELTGDAYQDRIVLTLVNLLREVKQPLVLMLEDLHWANQSLAPLKQIFLVKEQIPTLMIVATYRDDETPQLPDELEGMTVIKLNRLDETAVRALCASMLGERGVRDEMVQTIQRNSEGNTFFIIETVRALAEEHGSLANVTTAELPQVVFTGSMQELMQRRLSRVDDQYQDIQRLAAVIGRQLDLKLLNHRFDDSRIQAWLTDASNAAVLDVEENVWRFAHDKLRETLVADIPDEDLRQLHRTAAETIEAIYADDDAYNKALLSHWRETDNLDKHCHYLLLVADTLIQIEGAYTMSEQALASMLERLPDNDERRGIVWYWLSTSALNRGDYTASQQYAQQVQQLATATGNLSIQAKGLAGLGMTAFYQGSLQQADDYFQKSLAIFRQLGDLHSIADILVNMGGAAARKGYFDRASDLFQQSLTVSRVIGSQRLVADSLISLANLTSYQGSYEKAEDLYQQSLVILKEIGYLKGVAMVLHNMGSTAYFQSAFGKAYDLLQQSLTVAQQLGHQSLTTHNFTGIAWAAFQQGDSRSTYWFWHALNMAQNIHDKAQILRCLVGFAGSRIRLGQPELAAQLIGVTVHHPAQDTDVRRERAEMLALLEAALPPDDLADALEAGQSLDLDTVVAELLAEFAPSNEDTAEENE